ncbi:MFS transporter [Terriglobus albidus]|uniref:MFS transporter n=1 Tax=Terriglobus albidus TaxID=1592106 RepID=A0A5B9E8B2_9BACT|nr:MFS transporter [Terriglobus albidus]QEE27415.1 MFS transporter [Terriglobus albidus]
MSTQTQTQTQAPPHVHQEPMSMREVLKITTMRRLWYAQVVSNFGDFLALFAVISVLTFNLHATAQQVTGVQIAYQLPIALLGIVAGVFVDRWSLKGTLIASDLSRAVLCLLLIWAGATMQFYLILAAISIVSSFFNPAQGVTLRSAVPMHGLRSANALMQQVMFVMRIVGPAAAGVLVTALGAKACYIVDAISFVASASFIASITITRPPVAAEHQTTKTGVARVLHDMQQGIQFILHHAALLFVILALASGMFVLGCFGPLIAVYVRDVLHATTPRSFGAASASIGAGILLGMNLLNTFGKKMKNTVLVYAGLSGIAIGLVILAGIPYLATCILGNLVIGLSVAGIIIPAQTMIQQETPHHLMGRVGSTLMSMIFTAQILGLILSGVLAQHTGTRQVFTLCAVLLLILMAVGKLFMEPKTPATA